MWKSNSNNHVHVGGEGRAGVDGEGPGRQGSGRRAVGRQGHRRKKQGGKSPPFIQAQVLVVVRKNIQK